MSDTNEEIKVKKSKKTKKLIIQLLKFSVVGCLSFLIDLGIYTAIIKLMDWEWAYLLGGVAGFTISLIFNYFASMAFVFERKDNADKKMEFFIFLVLSLIGLGLNSLLLWVCVDILYLKLDSVAQLVSSWYEAIRGINFSVFGFNVTGTKLCGDQKELAEFLAKIVATFLVMVYNFISRKMTLEKKDE